MLNLLHKSAIARPLLKQELNSTHLHLQHLSLLLHRVLFLSVVRDSFNHLYLLLLMKFQTNHS